MLHQVSIRTENRPLSCQFQSLARGEGTTAVVGFTFGWNLTDRFGTSVSDQYILIEPLKADASLPDEQLYYTNEETFWGRNVISMSAACENKEAAMRFIDQFYDYDVSLEVMYGGMNEVDNCIKKNEDRTYEVLPPQDSSMDPSSWQWTNTFVNNGGMWVRNGVQVIKDIPDPTLDEKATYLPYQEKIPANCIYKPSVMKYTKADQNTMAMNETNMKNIWDQQVAAWITGTGDITAEWDDYEGQGTVLCPDHPDPDSKGKNKIAEYLVEKRGSLPVVQAGAASSFFVSYCWNQYGVFKIYVPNR